MLAFSSDLAADDHDHTKIPNLTGPYLGQEPPGESPEIFAPGIISTKDNIEFKIAISPQGDEFYFTRQEGHLRKILVTKKSGTSWTAPTLVSFSGRFKDEYPTISPDGQKLFFQSTRPLPDSLRDKGFGRGFKFWVTRKSGNEWGQPEILNASVNKGICISTVTAEGTIYFSRSSPLVIMKSDWRDGKYSAPTELEPPINDGQFGSMAACLSPREEYIIFASGRPGFGKSDLWISFKNSDESWGEPINMGSRINTDSSESSPVISPDGKYLFYSANGDIYWVDAKIIEKIRSK